MTTDPHKSPLLAPSKFSAFISYPHEDNYIASYLKDALISLDSERIDIFVDVSSIGTGKNIGEFITAALDKSDWFIGLGTDVTRPNFAWCGLELGIFIQNKLQKGLLSRSPIACLYTVEPPDLFHDRLQVKIVSLKADHASDLGSQIVQVKDSPIYKMLTEFAAGYRAYYHLADSPILVHAHEEWANVKAEQITDAYLVSLRNRIRDTWYPQKRIEIKTPAFAFWEKPDRSIPEESDVIIDLPVYSLFKLGAPMGVTYDQMKWGEFNVMVSREMGGPHLERIINDVVCSVLPNRDEASNDLTFVAPNRTRYRVILTRHVLYRDGRRDFIVNFIETLAIAPSGDKNTSLLVAAIMLASRFRFLFLEKSSEFSLDRISRYDQSKLAPKIKQLIREWKKIDIEAADAGLTDKGAIKRLIKHEDEVDQLYSDWWAWIGRFEDAASRFVELPTDQNRELLMKVYDSVQESTDQVNRRFIALCLEAYERELNAA